MKKSEYQIVLLCWILCLRLECTHPAMAVERRSRRLAPAQQACNSTAGWETVSKGCLFIGQSRQNWTESRDSCKAEDPLSDLASLPGQAYDTFLLQRLSTGTPYWVGYSYDHGWMDGSPELDTSRFRAATSGQNRCGHVAVLGNRTHPFLQWHLDDCQSTYPFICMINTNGAIAHKLASLQIPALPHHRQRKLQRHYDTATLASKYNIGDTVFLSRPINARIKDAVPKVRMRRNSSSSTLKLYSRKTGAARKLGRNLNFPRQRDSGRDNFPLHTALQNNEKWLAVPAPVQTSKSLLRASFSKTHQRAASLLYATPNAAPKAYHLLGAQTFAVQNKGSFGPPALVTEIHQRKSSVSNPPLAAVSNQDKILPVFVHKSHQDNITLKAQALKFANVLQPDKDGLTPQAIVDVRHQRKSPPNGQVIPRGKSLQSAATLAVPPDNNSHGATSTRPSAYQGTLQGVRNTNKVQGQGNRVTSPSQIKHREITKVLHLTKREFTRRVVPSFWPSSRHQRLNTTSVDNRRLATALPKAELRPPGSYRGRRLRNSQLQKPDPVSQKWQTQDSDQAPQELQIQDSGPGSQEWQPQDRGLRSHEWQPRDNGIGSQDLQPSGGGLVSREMLPQNHGPISEKLQLHDSVPGSQEQQPQDSGLSSQELQLQESGFLSLELQPQDHVMGSHECQPQDDVASQELDSRDRDPGLENLQPQDHESGSSVPRPAAERLRRHRRADLGPPVNLGGPQPPPPHSSASRESSGSATHNPRDPHAQQPRLCCLTHLVPQGPAVHSRSRRCRDMDPEQQKHHVCYIQTSTQPPSLLSTTFVNTSSLMTQSLLTRGMASSASPSPAQNTTHPSRIRVSSSKSSRTRTTTAAASQSITRSVTQTSRSSKSILQPTKIILTTATTLMASTPLNALTAPLPATPRSSASLPRTHSTAPSAKSSTVAVTAAPQKQTATQNAVQASPGKRDPSASGRPKAPLQVSSSSRKSARSVTTRVSTRHFTPPTSHGLSPGAFTPRVTSSSMLVLAGVTSSTVATTTTAATATKPVTTAAFSSSSSTTSRGVEVTTASSPVIQTSQPAGFQSSTPSAQSGSAGTLSPLPVSASSSSSLTTRTSPRMVGPPSRHPGATIDEITSRDDVVDFLNGVECNMSVECVSHVLLHPALSTDVKIDLLSDLVTLPSVAMVPRTPSHRATLTSYGWKQSIEYFFGILNRYLGGGSHHLHRQQLTDSKIAQTVLTLERFMERVMDRALRKNIAMSGRFSHLDFQIQNLSTAEIGQFRYQDEQNTCSISQVKFGHRPDTQQVSEEVVLVSVAMQVPHISVPVAPGGRGKDEGVIGSAVLLFSGYVEGRPRSLKHSFTLRQHFEAADDDDNVSYAPSCVFLEKSRMWSTYGCEVLNTEGKADDADSEHHDSSIVGCRCNHTSNFAILMQVVPFKVPEAHRVALSIITYIGCSITLITMVMAITVFTSIRSLNCERVCVHRNLCLAIVGAQITFLAGIEAVEHRLVCTAVALMLHYCYMAVFIWMLVEGLHLYLKVVTVFGTERSRINYYICFGWGMPLLLVSISAAADWEGYGTPTSCWLSTMRNTIWTFVGPALAIIFVNLVILGAVVKIVMASARLDKLGKFDHIRAGVKAALLLLPLLGLTWVFGLAAVNKDLIIFQYLFAFFNTLQGFFIFLFHCVFNTEVRQALKRLQEKRSLQRGDLSTLAGFTSSSPSASPTPSVLQEQKKPLGQIESPTTKLPATYKQNRVVPARYTSTTNIMSTTVPYAPANTPRDRRSSNQHSRPRKTQEMNLMFV